MCIFLNDEDLDGPVNMRSGSDRTLRETRKEWCTANRLEQNEILKQSD